MHTPSSTESEFSQLSFLFANIQGLTSFKGRTAKIPILKEDCTNEKFTFLCLTESHLDDSSIESEYYIDGYSNIVCNRSNRSKGGVIIYLQNHYTFQVLAEDSDEMCCFLAIFINELQLVLILTYRPPPIYDSSNCFHGFPLEQSFNNIIIKNLDKVISDLKTPAPDILLMGDFNFPNAKWQNGSGIRAGGYSSESKMLNQLIDRCDCHHLLQQVNFGTRPTQSGGSNTLDLIFTNNHLLMSSLSPHPSDLSDHNIITGTTSHNIKLNNSRKVAPSSRCPLASFNLNRANWEPIQESLKQQQWDTAMENKGNDEHLQIIINAAIAAIEPNCPKFVNRPNKSSSFIPRDRRILFRRRKRKLKAIKTCSPNSSRYASLKSELMDIEKKLITSYKTERLAEEEKAVENIKVNSKYFFSFARKHQVVKGGIGPLKLNSELITEPNEICEALSNQYSSVYSTPSSNPSLSNPTDFFKLTSDLPCLLDIEFTEKMIEDEIDSLKVNSAPGPDQFPALLLKKCKKELSKPLYKMWRASLDNNDIASTFRHAIVCPILKPNSASYLPKSYRPISLTFHLIKIFEKIMRRAIINHLVQQNLLPTNQHGFLQGRSTLSQLVSQTETIIRIL